MIPESIVGEVDALRRASYEVEAIEAEGWFNVVFSKYRLPPGYNKPDTTLLIKLPLSYRNGKPDMFWTEEDLRLQSGAIPRSADSIESALGKQWRRFSWHPQNWNPATDDLTTYLEFVNQRLAQAV